MKLFEVVPGELFSPLASPNRALYADALDVLYTAYRENLKIREDMLYSMLRSRMEQQLADATFEGEDIDEEELRDISGRARFLIRKLCGKGWFEKERGDDFEEYITVPSYSGRLLELFHQLRDDRPARGFSYVFGTYSALKVANESESVYDKMAAIYSAYDNTSALINLLQMVYHNVKHYFQMQIDMQDVNQVLASHFNEFGQKVVEAYIRPLKIKDSVPKYRVPIQSVLRSWAEDDALLLAMANAALQDKRGDTVENCRSDLLRKIFWIDERYDNIEHDYLDEIDAQVRRYTRAATQKVENLTNRDQNVRGNLNVLLTALSRNRRAGDLVDRIQPVFQLYEQSFLSEKSLWYRKRPEKRTKAATVLIQENASDADAAAQAAQLLRSEYGRAAIAAYVQGWLGDADVCYSKDLNIGDDKSYIIYARPELYELAGNCLVRTEQGTICIGAAPYGLALPSTLIDSITAIDLTAIQCITFIENKTNYDEYVMSEKQPGELVIYHGGFLSPQKRKLVTMIAHAAAKGVKVRFWADIDAGGFRMFDNLQKLISPVLPMRMSGELVEKFYEYGLMRSKEYLSELEADLKSGRYLLFKDAIEKILSYGVTIEQETFLN